MKGPAKNLYGPSLAMKILAMINGLMGLRPFNNHNGQPRILLSLPYLVVFWSLILGCLAFVEQMQLGAYTVDQYINRLFFYPYAANGVCLTFLGYYHAQTYLLYKEKMLRANENLYRLGVPPERRGSFDREVILIISWILLMAITFGVTLITFIPEGGVLIGLYICWFNVCVTNVGAVVLYDFVTCVRSLKSRYRKVNDLLEGFAENGFQTEEKQKPSGARLPVIPLRSNNWMRPRENVMALECVSRMQDQWEYVEKRNWRFRMIKLVHLELCQASNLLFKTFGTQVALQVRLGLLSITLSLYYICIYVILPQGEALSPFIKIYMIGGCIIDCAKLFLLSRACEYAYREAGKALTIVHACYPLVTDTEMKDEVRLFALQLCHCQRGCTKRYFCHLNYSLISRYVSTITTYLVITFQLSYSLESKFSSRTVNSSVAHAHDEP